MITEAEIAELLRIEAAATPGPWLVAHSTNKQPAVVDSQRRVILDSDTFAGDLEFCAAARNAVPRLVAALTEYARAVTNAADCREIERAERRDELRTVQEQFRAEIRVYVRKIEAQAAELARLRPLAERCAAHESELASAGPLLHAVREWRKFRHAPNLLRALEAYENG